MPFISASSCLTVCHGTHGESVSNTWRTRSQCVTEHRSMPYLVRVFYFHFLPFFLIQFRAQSAQPTVALSFQFVGHMNGLGWSIESTSASPHSVQNGRCIAMSWVSNVFHGRMNYIELFNEKYVCVVRFIRSFASTFSLWPETDCERLRWIYDRSGSMVVLKNANAAAAVAAVATRHALKMWEVWFGLAN